MVKKGYRHMISKQLSQSANQTNNQTYEDHNFFSNL